LRRGNGPRYRNAVDLFLIWL